MGFTMYTHYCGGQAVDAIFSMGNRNSDCGMEDNTDGCPQNEQSENQIQSIPCCENHLQILQLDENVVVQADNQTDNSVCITAWVYSTFRHFISSDYTTLHYSYFTPPLPEQDIQILFQTFLI